MRLIDGDALDDFLASAEIEAVEKKRYVLAGALNTIRGNLLNFPTIEPERKRGKWMRKVEPYAWRWDTWVCSECGEETTSTIMGKPRYLWCPMCGADMRGDKE